MIRVTVELVPYGVEDYKKVIARMKIVNNATGNKNFGNYNYEIMDEDGHITSGIYSGFPRVLKVRELIKRILTREADKHGEEKKE